VLKLAGLFVVCVGTVACGAPAVDAPPVAAAADPLPSWNDGAAKKALLNFVGRTTNEGASDFVPAVERVAVFDNDGTLWAEQPIYSQLAFAFDRVKTLAPSHPEWKTTQPFKGVIDGDMNAVLASGAAGLQQIVAASHTGITTEEFEAIVSEWIASARHPATGRRYDEMIYQPMVDVLICLRAHGYKTFIVSGGGVEFMRPWVGLQSLEGFTPVR
jgi:hypothetical protein